MNSYRSLQPFQASRYLHDAFHIRINFTQRTEVGCRLKPSLVLYIFFEAVLQRGVATHHQRWHEFGNFVAKWIRIAKHSGSIANSIAGLNGSECDDLCNVIATVFVGCIANHLIAIARIEVHVDVGHGNSTWVQEPFKDEVVLNGVKVCNAQAICNGTARSRTTTRSDTNVLFTRITNEVPHNEEIRTESHSTNYFKFIIKALRYRLWKFFAPALMRSLVGEVAQIFAIALETRWNRKVRQH